MKARPSYKLSQVQQKAFDEEINRQMQEWTKEHLYDYERICMLCLHKEFGFGEKRLHKFFNRLIHLEDELIESYGFGTSDILAEAELADIGVDVVKWSKEERKYK